MNRKILFRAKAINRDENISKRSHYKNGDWVYGLVTRLYDERFPSLPAEMTDINGVSRIEVDYRTIGQYTELNDDNGNKIFEGDIVRTHYANAQKSEFIEQVVFHNGRFCAYSIIQGCNQWVNLYDGIKHLPQDKSVYMDSIEVIGNVFDNLELLGV